MFRSNLFLFFLTFAFSIRSSNPSDEANKIDNKLKSLNIHSSISTSNDIQNLISSYLENNWKLSKELCFHDSVYKIVSSNDGNFFASLGNGLVKIWDISNSKCIKEIDEEKDPETGIPVINAISLSADGQYLASGSCYGNIKIWAITSGLCVKEFSGHKDSVGDLLYSNDGKSLISCSLDKTLKMWDLSTGKCFQELIYDSPIYIITESFNGRYLAVGLKSGEINLVKLNASTILNDNSLSSIPLPLNKIIADYALEDDKFQQHKDYHFSDIVSLTFSYDGNYLACTDKFRIKIFNIHTGDCIREIPEPNKTHSLVFLENNSLVGGLSGGIIKIWDINNGNTLETIQAYNESSYDMLLSYNAAHKYIASGVNMDRTGGSRIIKFFANLSYFLENQKY